jgi:16S rRNA (cytosine967-C5)-methyltransferase
MRNSMHPAPFLDLVCALLRSVLRFDQPADRLVSAFFRAHRQLGARERHAAAETVYEILRRRLLLQHLAQGGRGPLERRLALLGWKGESTHLARALAPDESAWLGQVRSLDLGALPPRLRHNLPEWASQPLSVALGDAEFGALAASLLESAPLDLRVNALLGDRAAAQAALATEGVQADLTRWSPWGLRCAGKPALNRLATFERGLVEVQDEGSQLLALLTGAARGEMVVDFCAGAGGKTLALGAMMRNTGRLYAFDTSDHRLAALKPRLARSGLSNVHPAAIAHERDDRMRRLAGKIDRVLVDAPCSGLGTLRRNPDLKWRQSPEAVTELAARQQAILAAAGRLLRPGGRLVYATCSLLRAENEDIADAFTQAGRGSFEPVPAAQVLAQARVTGAEALDEGGFLRLWPHRHGTDGFFAAVWERR